MARLRLGYTKSRTGCARCKQRRVKCDENRPCKACVRHNVECSLSSSSSSTPRVSPLPDVPKSPRRPTTPSARHIQPNPAGSSELVLSQTVALGRPPPTAPTLSCPTVTPPPDPFPYLPYLSNLPPAENQDAAANWASDIELFHHFITTTSIDLSHVVAGDDRVESVWRDEVPKLAFANTYLLHQVLAISAYHKAFLHPAERKAYSMRASQHQSHTIQGVRSSLASITPDNCHALFAAAALLFISALAAGMLEPSSPNGPVVGDLVDVLLLVRGIGGVLGMSRTLLAVGPLGNLFTRGYDKTTILVPDPKWPSLLERLKNLPNRSLGAERQNDEDEALLAVERACQSMGEVVQDFMLHWTIPEYRMFAAWPLKMEDAYVTLVRDRHPAALALLAYYCVILHGTEPKYWFSRGWGCGVLRDICKTLDGTAWYEDALSALSFIGGNPGIGAQE